MRRGSSGYTLLEVSIFLAISLAIAAASWKLIGGTQAEADFNGKMRDTQSKIQDWINDVSTGKAGGDPATQSCDINAGRPRVNSGGGPSATPYCIFLGKAIQFTDKTSDDGTHSSQYSSLYAYSVFGCRLTGCPTSTPGPTNVVPTDMLDASPKAALSLTETFSLAPAYVSSVSSSSHLIGFFNSLDSQNPASSNGAEDLKAYDFGMANNDTSNGSNVDNCLMLLSPCALSGGSTNPPALSTFNVCLTDGRHYAEITISSANSVGVQTNLTFLATC